MSQFEYKTYDYEFGKILTRKFLGKVKLTDIIESWEYLLNNNLLNNSHIGVINNLCGADLDMNEASFEQLIDYLKKNKIFQRIKLAVVCDSPEKIVFPMLGEYTVSDLHIKPFTTVDAAINWILNP